MAKRLSTQVRRLLPQYIAEENPRFTKFIEYYLEFIEDYHNQNGTADLKDPLDLLANLVINHDIDRTADMFLEHYREAYMNKFFYSGDITIREPSLSSQVSTDFRNLIKNIRDLYLSKGSILSIQFFFRSIYGTSVEVYLPKEDILRASDGVWFEPTLIRPDKAIIETITGDEIKIPLKQRIGQVLGIPEWSSTVSYSEGDRVWHGDNLWSSLIDNNQNPTFNESDWEVYEVTSTDMFEAFPTNNQIVGPNASGFIRDIRKPVFIEWIEGKTYREDDIVLHNDTDYIAKRKTTEEPGTGLDWDVYESEFYLELTDVTGSFQIGDRIEMRDPLIIDEGSLSSEMSNLVLGTFTLGVTEQAKDWQQFINPNAEEPEPLVYEKGSRVFYNDENWIAQEETSDEPSIDSDWEREAPKRYIIAAGGGDNETGPPGGETIAIGDGGVPITNIPKDQNEFSPVLAIDLEGVVYYSPNDEDGLYKLYPDGNIETFLATGFTGSYETSEFDVDSNRNVFATLTGEDTVKRFNASGDLVWESPSLQADFYAHKIQIFNEESVYVLCIGISDSSLYRLDIDDGSIIWGPIALDSHRRGLTIDDGGGSYVSGASGSLIKYSSLDGSQVWSYPEFAGAVWGIEYSPVSGTLWAIDSSTHEVHEIDKDGNKVSEFTIPEDDVLSILTPPDGYSFVNGSEYFFPLRLRVDGNGDLYFTGEQYVLAETGDQLSSVEYYPFTILKYDTSGNFIWVYAIDPLTQTNQDAGAGTFQHVTSLRISPQKVQLDGPYDKNLIVREKGDWISDDGFVSDIKKLQDNDFYQDFSYEIRTPLDRSLYLKNLKDNLHPSGIKIFNRLTAGPPLELQGLVNMEILTPSWTIHWNYMAPNFIYDAEGSLDGLDRDAYDTENEGFVFLDTDDNEIYIKEEADATWDGPYTYLVGIEYAGAPSAYLTKQLYSYAPTEEGPYNITKSLYRRLAQLHTTKQDWSYIERNIGGNPHLDAWNEGAPTGDELADQVSDFEFYGGMNHSMLFKKIADNEYVKIPSRGHHFAISGNHLYYTEVDSVDHSTDRGNEFEELIVYHLNNRRHNNISKELVSGENLTVGGGNVLISETIPDEMLYNFDELDENNTLVFLNGRIAQGNYTITKDVDGIEFTYNSSTSQFSSDFGSGYQTLDLVFLENTNKIIYSATETIDGETEAVINNVDGKLDGQILVFKDNKLILDNLAFPKYGPLRIYNEDVDPADYLIMVLNQPNNQIVQKRERILPVFGSEQLDDDPITISTYITGNNLLQQCTQATDYFRMAPTTQIGFTTYDEWLAAQ